MGPTGSTVGEMEPLTCPRCGTEMRERSLGLATVHQCPEGHGVFLDRAELGTLIEAETDWHAGSGTRTAPAAPDHPRHDRSPRPPRSGRGPGWRRFRLTDRPAQAADSASRSAAAAQMSRNVSMLAPSWLSRSARSS